MRRRNRWHVYNALKQTYTETGHVPKRDEIIAEFSRDTEPLEIEEGIKEFVITLRRFSPELTMSQVIGQ